MTNHKFLIFVLSAFLFGWWVVYPAMTYSQGTSVNISAEIISEPFLSGDELVYRWSGDVVRSCSISIRREFIDSNGVVTRLVPETFDPLPISELGRAEYSARIRVPLSMSEGPAVYQATEVPKCNWMQRVRPVAIEYPPVHFTVTRQD